MQFDASRLKTVAGVGFEVTRNVNFQESGYTNMYYRKINDSISTQDIECILLGCSSNTLGYPRKYCNYTSKKKLGPY